MKKSFLLLFSFLQYCTAAPAQSTEFAANDIELRQLIEAAAVRPITTIQLTGSYYNIKNIQLPVKLKAQGKRLYIQGQGTTVEVDSVGFERTPPDQRTADSLYVSQAFSFYRINFVGGGSISAINIGATYHTTIEDCSFLNFYNPVVLRFCMNARVQQCQFNYSTNNSLTIGYGNWPGATTSLSPSNCSHINYNRFLALEGSNAQLIVSGTTRVIANGNIFEGGTKVTHRGSNYLIVFDAAAGTNVNSFRLEETYIEVKATIAAIKINSREGIIVIDGIRNVFDNVLVSASAIGNTRLKLYNVDKLTGGTKFQTDRNTWWYVDAWPGNTSLNDSGRWVNKIKPSKLTVQS